MDGDQAKTELFARGADLHLGGTFDYVAIRLSTESGAKDVLAFKETYQRLAEWGKPCSQADKKESCLKELATAEVAAQKSRATATMLYAVTTSANNVRSWAKADELRELLGSIDSPNEAWFVVMAAFEAGQVKCGDGEQSAYRKVADGYEVRLQRYTSRCKPVELTELTYAVRKSGDARLTSSRVINSDRETCLD